jgi:hypothetical protein
MTSPPLSQSLPTPPRRFAFENRMLFPSTKLKLPNLPIQPDKTPEMGDYGINCDTGAQKPPVKRISATTRLSPTPWLRPKRTRRSQTQSQSAPLRGSTNWRSPAFNFCDTSPRTHAQKFHQTPHTPPRGSGALWGIVWHFSTPCVSQNLNRSASSTVYRPTLFCTFY